MTPQLVTIRTFVDDAGAAKMEVQLPDDLAVAVDMLAQAQRVVAAKMKAAGLASVPPAKKANGHRGLILPRRFANG